MGPDNALALPGWLGVGDCLRKRASLMHFLGLYLQNVLPTCLPLLLDMLSASHTRLGGRSPRQNAVRGGETRAWCGLAAGELIQL